MRFSVNLLLICILYWDAGSGCLIRTVCKYSILILRDQSIFIGEGGGGGGKNHGVSQAYFFREKGWAKREFHDGWGWVIVCLGNNHTL